MHVIARCDAGLYSRGVRNFRWQRWTLIFLLMARLVIGELGHAMPVTPMAPVQHATHEMSRELPCAEHEAGAQMPDSHASEAAADHASNEHDCCKSGDCECPCLHVPCVALDAAVMNPVALSLLRIPYGADSVPAERPFRLFRPPARFS
jgi:hypothetical protein